MIAKYIGCPDVRIIKPTNDANENYVVQEATSGNIHEIQCKHLYNHDPSAAPTNIPSQLSPIPHTQWIKHGCKATFYKQNQMKHPQQGIIKLVNNQW
jgi:hypothetical protein